MKFHFTSFGAILILLRVFIIVKCSGQLIRLDDQPTSQSDTKKLNSVDAAEIWNYNYQADTSGTGLIISEDFQPKNPLSNDLANRCPIWTNCTVQWEKNSAWDVVDSIIRPVDHVFGCQWKDEHLLTKISNAVISTQYFNNHHKNFCVKLLVGLCPSCQMKIDLVDRNGQLIATNSIIRGERDVADDRLQFSWRLVNLTATLQTPIPKLVRLKIQTILKKDEGRGQWAVDNFRLCDCQKLSYGTRAEVVEYKDRHGIRARRQAADQKPKAPPALERCRIYEADPDTNTISIACKPFEQASGEIESYNVLLTYPEGSVKKELKWTFNVSGGRTTCEYWRNYGCLENLKIPADAGANSTIQIYAKNKGVEEHGIPIFLKHTLEFYYNQQPSSPVDLKMTDQGHGLMMLTWKCQSFSNTKITEFRISVDFLETLLLKKPDIQYPITVNYSVVEKQKKYSMMLPLLSVTSYKFTIVSVNRRNKISIASEIRDWTQQSIGFATKIKPRVKFDGLTIEAEIPVIENATASVRIGIIVRGLVTCSLNQSRESLPLANQTEFLTEWSAAQYPAQDLHEPPEPFKMLIKQHQGVVSKCSMNLGETYTIVFVLQEREFRLNNYNNSLSLTTLPITLIEHRPPEEQNLAWLTIFPVLALCLLVLLAWHIYRKRVLRRQSRESDYVEPFARMKDNDSPVFCTPVNSTAEPDAAESRNRGDLKPKLKPSLEPIYLEIIPSPSSSSSTTTKRENNLTVFYTPENSVPEPNAGENQLPPLRYVYDVPNEPDSCSVEVKHFEEYVVEAAGSGVLRSQFRLLPEGLRRPCEYGGLPRNVVKNRYRNLIAYDETRVVLKKLAWDPFSDYINASYIKGYNKEKAYIAAQGPIPETVNDFWRMVWQEDVRVICMLTNVIEGTETMCEKYWPDLGTNMKYGDFYVSNIDDNVFADYTLRTFDLRHQHFTRRVKHLHYTGWPSLGVPSSGDDRTGTLILCDICLRQAAAEGLIDVTATITRMRDSRANMVGTLQQYLLAHIIVTEFMMSSLPTQIPCIEVLSVRMQQMRLQLPSHVQRLNDTMWQERTLDRYAETSSIYTVVEDTPGVNNSRMFGTKSSKFDAVSVDGVHTCCDIIPDLSIVVPMLHIRVENKSSLDQGEHFTKEKLLLTNTSEENAGTQSVTVLTCRGWGHGEKRKPPPPKTLVSLWIDSEKIPRKKGETFVLCHDGITGCGLYTALSFLLERMSVEGECDVISAVRGVRRSNPEFVQSLEQFDYLYDAAVSYAECFATYANFS